MLKSSPMDRRDGAGRPRPGHAVLWWTVLFERGRIFVVQHARIAREVVAMLTVLSWNMNQRATAWQHLPALVKEPGASIALLQEARRPEHLPDGGQRTRGPRMVRDGESRSPGSIFGTMERPRRRGATGPQPSRRPAADKSHHGNRSNCTRSSTVGSRAAIPVSSRSLTWSSTTEGDS